jgi:peptide/nickel transport system permease protein
MATQRPDRFDQVNWDEITGSRRWSLSTNAKGLLVTVVPVIAVALSDWLLLDRRTPTFEPIGFDIDMPILDYMFVFTLLLFAFYVIVPLYQHPRLTRYYWREFKRNRPAVISLAWLGIVFGVGLLGPLLIKAPEQNVIHSYQPPVYLSINDANAASCLGEVANGRCFGTWQYPLGTTRAGKDILGMLITGFSITLKIGFISTFIAVILGSTVGTVSAYAGGWVDEILMRYVDIQASWPTLIFYLLIIYAFGGSLWLLILLLGIFSWEGMARYVRSKALSISEEEYIKALNISGASSFRIVRRHVVPNSASSIITDITLLVPGFLLAEAQLSFLGLGDTTVDSWGQIIASGRDALAFAPWIVLLPGFTLFLTILAFNFVGDALLDALNPEAEAEADR